MSRRLNAALFGIGAALLAASPALYWGAYTYDPSPFYHTQIGAAALGMTLPAMLAGAVLMAGGLLRR